MPTTQGGDIPLYIITLSAASVLPTPDRQADKQLMHWNPFTKYVPALKHCKLFRYFNLDGARELEVQGSIPGTDFLLAKYPT